jgi:hypothetical protein
MGNSVRELLIGQPQERDLGKKTMRTSRIVVDKGQEQGVQYRDPYNDIKRKGNMQGIRTILRVHRGWGWLCLEKEKEGSVGTWRHFDPWCWKMTDWTTSNI